MALRLTAAWGCCMVHTYSLEAELVAAAVVRLLGPSDPPAGWPALSTAACVAARLAIFLLQDWTCPFTIAGLDVVQGWCIHTVGLGTAHRP
jgi:hypothetical protein